MDKTEEYNRLTIQEQVVIDILRKNVPNERIEILKTPEGKLGYDYVVYTAAKVRITPLGTRVPQNVRRDLQ